MSGTAQIFPVVGSNFNLPTPLPTQDVSDGTPGGAVPGTAIQVGGSDGTDLRPLATDSTGQLKVLIENPAVIPVQDASVGLLVNGVPTGVTYTQELQGSPLLAVMQQILLELKSLRTAMVTLVTEGGTCREEDFAPDTFTIEAK
jgi:hypothetical protein